MSQHPKASKKTKKLSSVENEKYNDDKEIKMEVETSEEENEEKKRGRRRKRDGRN